jgi:hypothetical protein
VITEENDGWQRGIRKNRNRVTTLILIQFVSYGALKTWQIIRDTLEKNLFPYPVLLKKSIVVYHNLDLVPTVKPPHLVIVYFLHMTEPVT